MMANYSKQEREIKRGDVYWCTMVGKGSQQQGLRPVMIISNDVANKFSPVINVAPLSTQLHKKRLPTHITLLKEDYSDLPKDSFLMLEQITLVTKLDLGNFITTVSITDEINRAVEIALGLIQQEPRHIKIAKEKSKDIKSLDDFITMWIYKGRDIQMVAEEVRERTLRIKDLVYWCNNNGLDVKDFYNEQCVNVGVNKYNRMVV